VRSSKHIRRIATVGIVCGTSLLCDNPAYGQLNTVSAHVEIKKKSEPDPKKGVGAPVDSSDVVLWLKPLDRAAAAVTLTQQSHKKLQLTQKDKSFKPHVLVVPVGSAVDFPNRDPYFHNVFSMFDGKRFDLGLYEAGASNSVRFDRMGVSFLFCNIHPEMSAVVIAVDTPYYGVSDHAGNITIPNLPDGKYEMHVWYERSLQEDIRKLTRTFSVSPVTKDLGTISVPENPEFSPAHKNKFGQDYTSPHVQPYSHP
jgi:plastocyanin